MCVRILSGSNETEFDTALPLEDQVRDADRVEIDFHPNDEQISSFIGNLEKMKSNGKGLSIKVKVIHNNYFEGGMIARKCSELTKDLGLNEFIKLMVVTHLEFDNRLEEISTIFSKV